MKNNRLKIGAMVLLATMSMNSLPALALTGTLQTNNNKSLISVIDENTQINLYDYNFNKLQKTDEKKLTDNDFSTSLSSYSDKIEIKFDKPKQVDAFVAVSSEKRSEIYIKFKHLLMV